MIVRARYRLCQGSPLHTQARPLSCRTAWLKSHSRVMGQRRTRALRRPISAQLSSIVMVSSQMRNPHYSLTVAEVLDSPLGYLALMAVPVGLYLMFKILLWDYTSRRTDDPNDPDRSQSFSLNARPGPGQMSQADLPPPVKHVVKDPALQAMAAEAASTVAEVVRQAKAHYEGELKLRRMNNDHVSAMEWEWVWSMLQSKQGSTAGVAHEEVLAKAQQQGVFDHAVHVVDGLHIDLTQLDQLEEFCNMSNRTLSTVSDTDGQRGALWHKASPPAAAEP